MTLFLPLWNICVTNDHGYVPHSWLITGLVTRLTRRVPLVQQKLLTLPMHMSSPPVFSEVRVTRSLVLCVSFVDRYLSCCPFSFGHCVVCPFSSYGFWLPHWYLQTRLIYVVYKLRFCTSYNLYNTKIQVKTDTILTCTSYNLYTIQSKKCFNL
jgi:hypothetical protein